MGSKRQMLLNGLGDLLKAEIPRHNRFVDLFAGSGAVCIHVSERFKIKTLGFDLQTYSAVVTGAVIERTSELKQEKFLQDWVYSAKLKSKKILEQQSVITREVIERQRNNCEHSKNLPITKAYGGHYFSEFQSRFIDELRLTLPVEEPLRTVALASLIEGAGACVAAPGHTAQPFQPTDSALKFLIEAWNRDIEQKVSVSFRRISKSFALLKGMAAVRDANLAAKGIKDGDLVFVDPPYSGVQYSRFYHVLETIANGGCGEVSGVGRYPDPSLRPRSDFSLITKSAAAVDSLFSDIATRGGSVIVTFPDHDCSNGLSGDQVTELASVHFRIKKNVVSGHFSSMGGTVNAANYSSARPARKPAVELVLLLSPR